MFIHVTVLAVKSSGDGDNAEKKIVDEKVLLNVSSIAAVALAGARMCVDDDKVFEIRLNNGDCILTKETIEEIHTKIKNQAH